VWGVLRHAFWKTAAYRIKSSKNHPNIFIKIKNIFYGKAQGHREPLVKRIKVVNGRRMKELRGWLASHPLSWADAHSIL